MVKRKNSSARLLLVVALLMIQLTHLNAGQPTVSTPTACTPATDKRNDGLTAGTCIAPTAACISNTATAKFYATNGPDCTSCDIGYSRATSTAVCGRLCPLDTQKYKGSDTACAAAPAACQTGYLESATSLAATSSMNDCLFCDITNGYVRANGRCKKLEAATVTLICTSTTTIFNGKQCVATFTKCADEYYAYPKATSECFYCNVGYKRDPTTTECKSVCPINGVGSDTRFVGYEISGAAKCQATTGTTACLSGYAKNPLDTTNKACTNCDVGFIKRDGKCVAADATSCVAVQGAEFTSYNGQACAKPPSSGTGCLDNYASTTAALTLCTICDIGFIKKEGKCVQVTQAICIQVAGQGKEAFNGKECVTKPSAPTYVTCDPETNTEADLEKNLCIYCKVGFTKVNGKCLPVQTASTCGTANPHYDGETCKATLPANCLTGYASSTSTPSSLICDICAFGYVRSGGKCIIVSTTSGCGGLSIFKGYDGQKCVSTSTAVTCSSLTNSFANYKTPNLCIYCKLGYRLEKGKCIEIQCLETQYWDSGQCTTKTPTLTCSTTGTLLDSSNRCIQCDFGYVPYNFGTDATTPTKCDKASTTCNAAYDGSACVASLSNSQCTEPFYPTSTTNAQICDGCNFGYAKSAGTCKKAQEACATGTNPAYSGKINQRVCGPVTSLLNSKDCTEPYYAPISTNTNLCTACDFRHVLYQGDCVKYSIGCPSNTAANTPYYDGKKCVSSTGFKCLEGYFALSSESSSCQYCDVGFTYKKGGCFEFASTCNELKPNFNGMQCVGTTDFKCFNNLTFGYHANEQTSTKCNYCDIGFQKIVDTSINKYTPICKNATSKCTANQKWDGTKCVANTVSCSSGYTFNKGLEKLCIICDIGFKKVNGTCTKIICPLDKPKFDGNKCDFQHVACLTGYAASRENPLRCSDCASGYKKENGACILATCQGDKPKWSGTDCVASTANCATGYAVGDNANSCTNCAQKYESNAGKCILSCVAPNTKFIGNGCGAPTAACASGYKDNGEGKCIESSLPCAEGYIFNGVKDCAKDCATNFRNNGLKFCVSSKSACAAGFKDVGGSCVIVPDNIALLAAKTSICGPLCLECDDSGNCISCKNGYMLIEATKRCTPCQGCQTCAATNPGECTSCFAPLALSLDTKNCTAVSSCDKNCLQCNIAGRCLSCNKGYQTSNGTCQKCTVEGCITCSTSAATCQACGQGMKLADNKCYPCTVGCLTCKIEDLSSCDGCVKGYYPLVNGSQPIRCLKCVQNCSVCQSASVCLTCKEGYVLSTNKDKCTLRCSSNCATCQENLPDKCSTCFTGGVLGQNSSKCEYSVTSCNLTSTCTFCPDGHVLRQKKCFKCSYAVNSNCNACSPDTLSQCVGCATGFYLQNKACVKCDAPCLACAGKGVCLSCNVGFYLSQLQGTTSGSCLACDGSCLTCATTPTQCTSCRNTSLLTGTNCISNNSVTMQAKLDIDIDKFYTVIEVYRQWVVDQANKALNSTSISKSNLQIINITKGSTDVASVLSLENQNAISILNIANAINQAIASGAKVGNTSIQSGTSSANFIQNPTTTTEESSSSKLGLILGLSIPLGLLFLVAVIVIIYKLCQRKNDQENYKGNSAVKNYSSKNLETGDRYEEKV